MAAKKKNSANPLVKGISLNRQAAKKQEGFSYIRKLSEPEQKGGYIFINAENLQRFPPAGQEFIVKAGKKKAKAKVEAYACNCTGPGMLHSHYKITGLKGLIGSRTVKIREASSGFVLEKA